MSHSRFHYAMRQAIMEAKKGRFNTFPNPVVGAVLLHDGNVVARGHHSKAGAPHAEIACLLDAESKGISPRGLTMVVTLEPCNHQGKTGPCSEALIKAGITKVIIGCKDPNPVAQGGAERLREAGIEVIEGVLETQCRLLIADYLTWLEQKRPFIILKLASTLDGRIATRTGQSRWVTGEEARADVHRLRAGIGNAGGVVLVGGKTFRTDDPELTARGVYAGGKQPRAGVLTSTLPNADHQCHLLCERPEETIFLVPDTVAHSDRAEALRKRGVTLLSAPRGATSGNKEYFEALFKALWDQGCPYVLCEGGGRLGLNLIEAGCVDIFLLHMSPMLLGDNQATPLFDGRQPQSLTDALRMKHVGTRSVGADLCLGYVPTSAWFAATLNESELAADDNALWSDGSDALTYGEYRKKSWR